MDGLSDVSIDLEVDKDNKKYWLVSITYYENSHGYAWGTYYIDYYTGEILTSVDNGPLYPQFRNWTWRDARLKR